MLVESQKPFVTVVGCSDSRVPPELIFDVGFGDLFTIRLAGNIIAEDVIGSLQYAVAHLHTPLVVILGHEGCGAVAATMEEILHKTKELKHIESLIQSIKPGLKQLDLKLEHDAFASCRRGQRTLVYAGIVGPSRSQACHQGKAREFSRCGI